MITAGGTVETLVSRGAVGRVLALTLVVGLVFMAIVAGPASPARAIIGGENVVANGIDPLPAVVRVITYTGHAHSSLDVDDYCSGTLIAANWVLTAQHCTNVGGVQGKPHARGDFDVKILKGPSNSGLTMSVAAVYRMDGYDQNSGVQDIALLRLSKPVTDVKPLPLLDGSAFTSVRKIYRYGYGETKVGGGPSSNVRRSSEQVYTWNQVEGLHFPTCSSGAGGGSSTNTWASDNALWTSPINGGGAKGDSGGPALVDLGNGSFAVAGVTQGSIDLSDCNDKDPDPLALKGNFVGDSNRADSGGRAWGFIDSHATDATTAAPPTTPPPASVPAAPNLTLGTQTTSSITLNWSRPSGAVSYRVYEGSAVISTVSDPTTTATISGLISNTAHSYTVTAVNSGGESAHSNTVTATTLPTWTYSFVSQSATDASGATADLAHARPGQTFTVSITVRNTGTGTWTSGGSNPLLLGTARPQDHPGVLKAPGWVSSTRAAHLQQSSVAPGGTGSFQFPIMAPDHAGTVTEYFNLVAEGLTWLNDAGLSVTVTTVPVTAMAIAPDTSIGQWVVAADGGVFAYAGAPFYGSMGGRHLNAPIVGIAATPSGHGYWLVGSDGGVFTFGDAPFAGSLAGQSINAPIVGMTGTPDGNGYWLVGADGGVYAFGDAVFYGSMGGQHLNAPVVGITATPSGHGYLLAAADGGVFAYGDAIFSGSMVGKAMNGQITSIAATADGRGYWLAGSDGGVYAFGTAGFGGSLGAAGSPRPIVAIARTATGYALADQGGAVSAFTTPGSPAPRNTLYPGERLQAGEQLTSPNGRYILVMQADGNLVEYDSGRPVWASGTSDANSTFEAQADGNFVIYAPGHVARWATNTNQANSIMVIQDDRNVVIYAPGNVAVWATGTST